MMSTPVKARAKAAAQPPVSENLADTRTRILRAAQRLFRKRGYHATGLNDILELAQAPKGSMYHHFPGGKEAIGVCVIEDITAGLLGLFAQSRARSTQALMQQVGEQLVVVAEKTQFEICALYSAFAAERKASPLLGQAVAAAYGQMIDALQVRLMQDGVASRLALERAQLAVALLEGGSLLAQSRQDAAMFRLTVKQAAQLLSIAKPP
jgi:TetR/AcrR family transcriptional regulator, lmrAB and yxaGH operons repressor